MMRKSWKLLALIAVLSVFAALMLVACDSPRSENGDDYVPSDKDASAGLEYELSADETYYTLTGLGACLDKDIVIPTQIKNVPVKVIAKEAFLKCEDIETLYIPQSIVRINDSAFENCNNLTKVTIAYGVEKIPNDCFSECRALKNISIPASVKEIGNYAFSYTGFETFTIPDTVEKIGMYLFYNCSFLKSVQFSSRLTELPSNIFAHCPALTEFTVQDEITKIGSAAFSSSGLTTVTITDSVTEIGESAFSGCENLHNVKLSKNITEIPQYTFSGCTNLTAIEIPDKVTFIGESAFSRCTNLTAIKIPDKVTFIGNYAFYSCKNLKTVNIPKNTTRLGNSAFASCDNLRSVTFADANDWEVRDSSEKLIKSFTAAELSDPENAAAMLKKYDYGDWIKRG